MLLRHDIAQGQKERDKNQQFFHLYMYFLFLYKITDLNAQKNNSDNIQ
jgi:hypothetical protein